MQAINHAALAAEEIRERFRSEVDKWRLVPRLALEADGRGGWSQQYDMAYRHGYWDVDGYTMCVFVDLANGELVSFGGPPVGTRSIHAVSDETILGRLRELQGLRADGVIAALEENIKKPSHQPEKHEQNVRTVVAKYGLRDVYDASMRISPPVFTVGF